MSVEAVDAGEVVVAVEAVEAIVAVEAVETVEAEVVYATVVAVQKHYLDMCNCSKMWNVPFPLLNVKPCVLLNV